MNHRDEMVQVWLELIDTLPRCSMCRVHAGTMMNADRWWLCEACWFLMPWPEAKPQCDLRKIIARAREALS